MKLNSRFIRVSNDIEKWPQPTYNNQHAHTSFTRLISENRKRFFCVAFEISSNEIHSNVKCDCIWQISTVLMTFFSIHLFERSFLYEFLSNFNRMNECPANIRMRDGFHKNHSKLIHQHSVQWTDPTPQQNSCLNRSVREQESWSNFILKMCLNCNVDNVIRTTHTRTLTKNCECNMKCVSEWIVSLA